MIILCFPMKYQKDECLEKLKETDIIRKAENGKILLNKIPMFFDYEQMDANSDLNEIFEEHKNNFEEEYKAICDHKSLLFFTIKLDKASQLSQVINSINMILENGGLGVYQESSGLSFTPSVWKEMYSDQNENTEGFVQILEQRDLIGTYGMQALGLADIVIRANCGFTLDEIKDILLMVTDNQVFNDAKAGCSIEDSENKRTFSLAHSSKTLFPKKHEYYNSYGYLMLSKK